MATTNSDNARRFALDLSKFIEKDVPEAAVAFHKQVTLDLLRRVVDKSPVGNPSLWKSKAPKGYIGGSFRNFWQVYTGSDPGNGALPPPKGTQAKPVPGATGRAALAGLVPFSTTYIVNGLPYAKRLNEGWSSVAPAGFVEMALAEVANDARAALEVP